MSFLALRCLRVGFFNKIFLLLDLTFSMSVAVRDTFENSILVNGVALPSMPGAIRYFSVTVAGTRT